MTVKHSLVSLIAKHPVHKWEHANAAARTGETVTATDLGAISWQTDNDTFWVAITTAPAWLQVVTSTGAGFTTDSVAYGDGSGGLKDDGADFSYDDSANVLTLGGGVTFTGGGAIESTSNGNINLTPNGTGITAISSDVELTAGGDISSTSNGDIRIITDGTGQVMIGNSATTPRQMIEVFSTGTHVAANQHLAAVGELTWGVAGSVSNALFNTNRGGYEFRTGQSGAAFPGTGTARLIINTEGLTAAGSFKHNVTTVSTATGTLATDDYIVHITRAATGTCTFSLPDAQAVGGRTIVIKDAAGNASGNTITIDNDGGSGNIDGAASVTITTDYGVIELYGEGGDWYSI